MVPALNTVNTTVACLGNHDLDFGVKHFQYLASQCTFPWLCANVLDPALGDDIPLANCKKHIILTASNGIKIGVIGIVEREWLDTINSLPPNLQYFSASATVAELAPKLREKHGAEMVIVLTHQREPNDNKLATKLAPGTVDLILGGHDHFYGHSVVNGTHILRSGTDFKQLSYIEARRRRRKDGATSEGWQFDIVRRDIVSSYPEDAEAAEQVESLTHSLSEKLEKPIGYTAAPLDARFTTVRLKESNLANFVCDLMRFHYFADCAVMAAGTVRGDQIYPPGVLKVRDMMDCFPFEDPSVVVGVTGQQLLDALENGVSKYPALEGRFPQVSGIHFTFDPKLPPGKRCSDVSVGGRPIELEKEYTLVTRAYMVQGKDGFTSLRLPEDGGTARSIVSEENGMILSTILRQYFMSLKVLGRWKNWNAPMYRHWDKIQTQLHGVHPVQEPVGEEEGGAANGSVRVPNGSAKGKHSSSPPAKRARIEKMKQEQDDVKYVDHMESEDEDESIPLACIRQTASERDLHIMRKYSRKWWRLAGLPGHPDLVDGDGGDDDGVSWAMGIAPRVEGRIRIVGEVG